MTNLEKYWREFLAEHPEVRAMDRPMLNKVRAVWLDGAQGLLLSLRDACPGVPDLEALKAALDSSNDEIMAGITVCHGREV